MNRILVTGGSGFLARHIIHRLLIEGHEVRTTVRDVGKAAAVERSVAAAATWPGALDVVACDLTQADGWQEAVRDCDAVIHTASPFPQVQPRNAHDLVGPAVSGTKRVLEAAAAAGTSRVVLTSSIAAMIYSTQHGGGSNVDEDSWTDPGYPGLTPYARSKTLAERTAWDIADKCGDRLELTVINPGFIAGPPLDGHIGTSLATIQRLLEGRDPMLPAFGFPTVDVRDVAELHVLALNSPETIGRRLVASERFLWYHEMAEMLKAAYPRLPIVTRRAPDFAIRALAWFDASARSILPDLGRRTEVDSSRTSQLLGFRFRDARTAVLAAAAELVRSRLA